MEQQLLSPLKAEVPSVPENDEWQVTTTENVDAFPVVHEGESHLIEHYNSVPLGSLTLAPIQLSTPQVPPFNNNDAMKNPMELLQQMGRHKKLMVLCTKRCSSFSGSGSCSQERSGNRRDAERKRRRRLPVPSNRNATTYVR